MSAAAGAGAGGGCVDGASPAVAGGREPGPGALAERLLQDHPPLGDKVAAALGSDRAGAGEALAEVIRFLTLVAGSEERLSPPRPVDLAWHELILFTRGYSAFCREQFGTFIHHEPGGDAEENRSGYRRALRLYARTFGEPDPRFWGENPYWGAAGACGACEAPGEIRDEGQGA